MLDLHSQPILICFLMYKRSKVRRHLGPESVREFSICDLTEILHAYTQTTPRACSKVFKNSFVFASCSSCGSGKRTRQALLCHCFGLLSINSVDPHTSSPKLAILHLVPYDDPESHCNWTCPRTCSEAMKDKIRSFCRAWPGTAKPASLERGCECPRPGFVSDAPQGTARPDAPGTSRIRLFFGS